MNDLLDAALYRALHTTSGASERWARLRAARDVTDEGVLGWVAYEWGPQGGFAGPGGPSVIYCGGKSPRFWLNVRHNERPTLEGAALVEAVRRVLSIPRPKVEPEQQELFG